MRDLGTFRGDQAIELSSVTGILHGKFTLIGIKTSISDVHNGAVMYYLLAPFLYVFRYDPMAGGILQTILQLGAIVVIYSIGKVSHKESTGMIAAFIFAFSALLVRFSRQTLLAFYPLFFCTLAFFLMYRIAKKQTKMFIFILGIILGISLQVHFSTVSLVLAALAFPWFFCKRNRNFYYILLVSGISIGFIPMLLFEIRHQFFNTHMFLKYLQEPKITAGNSFRTVAYWQNTLAQLLFGGNQLLGLTGIIVILLLLFMQRKKLSLVIRLSLLQLVASVLFTALFVKEMMPHYAISSFTPIVFLIGYLVTNAIRMYKRTYVSTALSFLLIFFFVFFQIPAYGLFDTNAWTSAKGWNEPGVKKAARLIFQDAKTNQFNVVMVVDAENQALPLRYFLNVWGKPPLSVTQYDRAEKLYVVTEPGTDLSTLNMWEITSFGAFTVEQSWPIQNGFFLHRLGKRSV